MENLRAPTRRDTRVPQHAEQRLPVAPQDPVIAPDKWQPDRLGVFTAQRLEHHRSLRFEARHRHLADERRRRIEEAACRARFRAIDAPQPRGSRETIGIRR